MADEGNSQPGAHDDELIVESLGEGVAPQGRASGWLARLTARVARRLWERRRSGRARLARGALVVTLLAATLFGLLGGPALTLTSWQRLALALRSGILAPHLAMTAWRQVTPPAGVLSASLTYTTDPATPTVVYACQASATGTLVWRSDTLGRYWVWRQASQAPAQSCQVKVALDSSAVALLVMRSPDPLRAGCQRISLAISPSAGAAWSPVSLPAAATGAGDCVSDAWASAHWIFAWWSDGSQPEPSSALMRSGDGGATWQNADGGLPARGAYLAPALTSYGAGGALLAQVYYWPQRGRLNILRQVALSRDDGATWEALGKISPGATLHATLEPRVATAGAWSAFYALLYTDAPLSPLWSPDQPPEGIQAFATRTGVWSELPPLPVNGATANDHRMGVALALGVAPASLLLTLGVDPHSSVTDPLDARDLWLWAWDPVAAEWRLGEAAPPNARLAGFSWGAGPSGGPYAQTLGAYLWLSSVSGGSQTLASAFIPVVAAGQARLSRSDTLSWRQTASTGQE